MPEHFGALTEHCSYISCVLIIQKSQTCFVIKSNRCMITKLEQSTKLKSLSRRESRYSQLSVSQGDQHG